MHAALKMDSRGQKTNKPQNWLEWYTTSSPDDHISSSLLFISQLQYYLLRSSLTVIESSCPDTLQNIPCCDSLQRTYYHVQLSLTIYTLLFASPITILFIPYCLLYTEVSMRAGTVYGFPTATPSAHTSWPINIFEWMNEQIMTEIKTLLGF